MDGKEVGEALPVSNILAGLKDFQRATVERIADLYKAGQRKILVCDEVGLGKTLIARGAILKIREMRRASGQDSVRVVYICSNAVIADQNLARLGAHLDADIQNAFSGRLSMQHLHIFRKEARGGLQLIPLTPATSFSLTGHATGRADERALIYAMLTHVPALEKLLRKLAIILCNNIKSWDWRTEEAERKIEKCDRQSGKKYIKKMIGAITQELAKTDETGQTLLERLQSCCEQVKKGHKLPDCAKVLVRSLRFAFAQISVGLLKPDLVIMDEFQRFRSIIEADDGTETGLLKKSFFKGGDCRILMLSATPYKLYTTLEEQEAGDVEDHYREFLQVLDFLQDRDLEKKASFKKVWDTYSLQLREFSQDNASLLLATRQAEEELYKYICRTERIGESLLCAEVDASSVKIPVKVGEADITAYLECRKLAEKTGASTMNLAEYVKSSPYLLSFMGSYEFKRDLERFFRAHPAELKPCKKSVLSCKKSVLWLKPEKINGYETVPANNGRLDALLQASFKAGEECLLWLPPAKPYYGSGAKIFRKNADYSKILIFSAWEMVPRMLASLVSYEAERRSLGKLAGKSGKAKYFSRRKVATGLQFRLGQKRVADSRQVFSLLNPSQFLIDAWNPLESLNKKLGLGEIRAGLVSRIKKALDKLPNPRGAKKDHRWYYLAPLLLDDKRDVDNWLEKLKEHAGQTRKKEKESLLQKHVKELAEWYEENGRSGADLGPRPKDLAEVLADLALASPAVCFARALSPYAQDKGSVPEYAFRLAELFLRRCLNSPEGARAIAQVYKKQSALWLPALTYCRDGNLQAVLDEYAFILAYGMVGEEDCLERLAQGMEEGLDFHTASYNADTYENFKMRISGAGRRQTMFMRTHFCAAFARGDSGDEEKDIDRKSSVRKSFNSPFRPFVLATTSIGQEGLDFHSYCRRIMHWNLPHNPVELEQREGRINRFMGHMIRQNVARRYGDMRFEKSVWKELFEEAQRQETAPGCSELIPWWGLREKKDMLRLERLVPMFPYSADNGAYERLIAILALYRLSLGQPSQEDLLDTIARRCTDPGSLKKFFINLSPFYRGQQGRRQTDA